MIKLAELKTANGAQYRVDNPERYDLNKMQTIMRDRIVKANAAFGLPIRVTGDEVKTGGVFGRKAPCLVIQNTEHTTDYFQIVLTFDDQGKIVMMKVWNYGRSPLFEQAMKGKMRGLGGAIKNSVFGSKDRWQEEQNYYNALYELLDKC